MNHTIHNRIVANANIVPQGLDESKLLIDSSRAALQLIADHMRRGVEIREELLEALLFRLDCDLKTVSEAIVAELCGGQV